MADLQVTKSGSPNPVIVGNNITYTINFVNHGPASAQAVMVTDPVPAHTTFVSASAPAGWTISSPAVGGTGNVVFSKATVTSGQTAVFTLVVNVNSTTPSGTSINNTVTTSSTTTDPTPGNNASSVGAATAPCPSAEVYLAVSPNSISQGQNAVFTISTTHGATACPKTVYYSMSGTAHVGSDYTLSGTFGQVTIPAGQSSATVTLHALQNGNKTATMTLNNGSGYTVSTVKGKATVTLKR
jgi:uncharacterized repeat protein (TIGR01451 family)